MSFDKLGLSTAVLETLVEQGYHTPTPIQAQAIPAIISGRDVMAAARTGTGKTAGFTLPLLDRLAEGPRVQPYQARALIITPTRELAAQVEESVKTYGKNHRLRSAAVFGGVNIKPQLKNLRPGVDILVATPGRLLDLYGQKAVHFKQLEVLVLDEADRMLDMGFIHDIRRILALLPPQRQNLLFSATFSVEIRDLARGMINNPVEIAADPRNTTVEAVSQLIIPVDKSSKSALLRYLIKEEQWEQALVFSRTKHGANRLALSLEKKGIRATAIHGNKSQSARTKALADFKSGRVRILVATDIAARGLDIDRLPHVVNFDLPNVPEDYVHRIGRTGRAGAGGQALSLVSAEEFKLLQGIERLIKQQIPRKLIPGFEPVNPLPSSTAERRPQRSRKPPRPRQDHRNGQRSSARRQGRKPAAGRR